VVATEGAVTSLMTPRAILSLVDPTRPRRSDLIGAALLVLVLVLLIVVLVGAEALPLLSRQPG